VYILISVGLQQQQAVSFDSKFQVSLSKSASTRLHRLGRQLKTRHLHLQPYSTKTAHDWTSALVVGLGAMEFSARVLLESLIHKNNSLVLTRRWC
jgi:hypothetical protein